MSDIDTIVVDGLKALDPEWPIREADIRKPLRCLTKVRSLSVSSPQLAISFSAKAHPRNPEQWDRLSHP